MFRFPGEAVEILLAGQDQYSAEIHGSRAEDDLLAVLGEELTGTVFATREEGYTPHVAVAQRYEVDHRFGLSGNGLSDRLHDLHDGIDQSLPAGAFEDDDMTDIVVQSLDGQFVGLEQDLVGGLHFGLDGHVVAVAGLEMEVIRSRGAALRAVVEDRPFG